MLILLRLTLFIMNASGTELNFIPYFPHDDSTQHISYIDSHTYNLHSINSNQTYILSVQKLVSAHQEKWNKTYENITDETSETPNKKRFDQSQRNDTWKIDYDAMHFYLSVNDYHVNIKKTKYQSSFFEKYISQFSSLSGYKNSIFFLCYMVEDEFDDIPSCIEVVEMDIQYNKIQMDALEELLTNREPVSEVVVEFPRHWLQWFVYLYDLSFEAMNIYSNLCIKNQLANIGSGEIPQEPWHKGSLYTVSILTGVVIGLCAVNYICPSCLICSPSRHPKLVVRTGI